MSEPQINVNNISTSTPGDYTSVTVKNKNSGETFVIQFKDARIKGNEAEWTIKDGKVYDKYGKTIEDNILEVTRYQAALIKAAAKADGNEHVLDQWDLNGGIYADFAKKELQNAQSEYKLDTITINGGKETIPAADATEGGVIWADVINDKEETGSITIDIRTEEQLAEEQRRKEEAEKYFEQQRKPWWKFW